MRWEREGARERARAGTRAGAMHLLVTFLLTSKVLGAPVRLGAGDLRADRGQLSRIPGRRAAQWPARGQPDPRRRWHRRWHRLGTGRDNANGGGTRVRCACRRCKQAVTVSPRWLQSPYPMWRRSNMTCADLAAGMFGLANRPNKVCTGCGCPWKSRKQGLQHGL